MKINSKEIAWLLIPVAALLFVIARIYSVLPAVMQDEYIYSTESRHVQFSSQQFPNYLFSWVYSSTSTCGEGYYSCAKNLNILFLVIGLIFVYLIARKLIGSHQALAIVTITILSPVGVNISFFMPESMYFAFMMVTIWTLTKAASENTWNWWTLSGLILGFATLVKPHALFALPVTLLFAFVISLRAQGGTWLKSSAFTFLQLIGVLLIKFGLGFVFAGQSALSFFGSGYGSTLNKFVGNSTGQAAGTGGSTNVSSSAVVSAPDIWSTLFEVGGLQLLLHWAVLLVLWGIPVFLSLSVSRGTLLIKKTPTDLGAFVTLVGGLAVTYVIVVAGFEGFVTSMGDDHTNRVITRYYDFLIPLLLILSFSISKYVEAKLWIRIFQTSLVIGAAAWAVFYFPGGITPKIADSIPLMGLLYFPAVLYLIAAIVIFLQIFWFVKPELGGKIAGMYLIPLVVLTLGFSAQGALLSKIGTEKAYFDIAGQSAKLPLSSVDGSKILVVGGNKPDVVTAKFWIDKPSIQDLILAPGSSLVMSQLSAFDYALFLGTSQVEGAGQSVVSGEQYVLIKISH